MDRLDRGAGANRAILVDPEQARRGDGQQRPQFLAPADRGMAHRGEQSVARVARRLEQLRENRIDRAGNTPRLGVEVECVRSRLVDIERRRSRGLAVRAEPDLLDPLLRRLQPRFAMAL